MTLEELLALADEVEACVPDGTRGPCRETCRKVVGALRRLADLEDALVSARRTCGCTTQRRTTATGAPCARRCGRRPPVSVLDELTCPYCGAKVRRNEMMVCPGCSRDGCPECMPAGRGCECPECEEGSDDDRA